jgi:hypothetical protein
MYCNESRLNYFLVIIALSFIKKCALLCMKKNASVFQKTVGFIRGRVAVPGWFPLFLSSRKHDKQPVLVYHINLAKPAVLHPRELHREFLILIKSVPPVQHLFLIFR